MARPSRQAIDEYELLEEFVRSNQHYLPPGKRHLLEFLTTVPEAKPAGEGRAPDQPHTDHPRETR